MSADKENVEQKPGWHLEKSVSLSHIFTTLSIAVAVLLWMNKIDKRVDQNALINQYQDQHIQALKLDIQHDLTAIKKSVDKLLDRELSR